MMEILPNTTMSTDAKSMNTVRGLPMRMAAIIKAAVTTSPPRVAKSIVLHLVWNIGA
jgi:hypothetical protein